MRRAFLVDLATGVFVSSAVQAQDLTPDYSPTPQTDSQRLQSFPPPPPLPAEPSVYDTVIDSVTHIFLSGTTVRPTIVPPAGNIEDHIHAPTITPGVEVGTP